MLAEDLAALRATTARHLHGKIERTCALSQGKGLIRIGQCRREQRVPSVSDSPTKCPTRTTCAQLLVVLAHPQGVAATFSVGQHHYPGPLYENQSLTHTLSLTPLPLTSPLPNTAGCPATVPDRILRLPCGRLAPVAHHTFVLDALKRACRRPSLQPSRSTRCALSGCRGCW